jgi:alkanesulfonate monooxygenase SsuD/methylene tetrahydromethanopterin reductase-like flavin-dependent oxidoreductase (luciferase family)
VELGAHLPLIDFGDGGRSLRDLVAYTRAAERLGFRFLCANDHLVYSRPWLDGPTALSATLEASGQMSLATTVALPVVRGAIQLAKTLATLHHLSGGRVVAGVGPGSSTRDYAAVGIPFEERWRRLDEAIPAMRSFWRDELESAGEPSPPIWVGSWGSAAGLRRVARLGDGWLASGYNTTPDRFRECLTALGGTFTNAIATMWLYVTESRRAANAMLADVLAPMLGRSLDQLAGLPLPIGGHAACAETLAAYRAAGAERVFFWPLADDLRQLELAASL